MDLPDAGDDEFTKVRGRKPAMLASSSDKGRARVQPWFPPLVAFNYWAPLLQRVQATIDYTPELEKDPSRFDRTTAVVAREKGYNPRRSRGV